ncbi:MAG: hypothetical protein U0168_04835 [Nannocystaceae bacterium]
MAQLQLAADPQRSQAQGVHPQLQASAEADRLHDLGAPDQQD